jgi:tetratricopeptide (TPR) repeat protein
VRSVVFIGNCQIQSIYHLYQRFATQSAGERLLYIKSYESIEAADRLAIEQADVIIEQVQDFQPKADVAGIPTQGKKIGVPVVHCGFLWPFAGQPHPSNPSLPYLEGGPYGSESSDGFLNRLIKKGTDVESAVQTYLDLDINKTVNLDRLLEMVLEKQQMRDDLTGFNIANIISRFFKTEPVFLTPYHPNLRIAMELVSQTLKRLDVTANDIEQMRIATQVTPFPKEELPVHPAVARHFGLTWATEDRRYRFLNEGRFTFWEFATRYMTCDWNPALAEGLNFARERNLEQARVTLTEALEKSPGSAVGWGSLSSVYWQMNEPSQAMTAILKALELDPDSPNHHLHKAILLNRDGEEMSAEREYRIAAALEPFDSHYPGMLANFLSSKGRYREARAVSEWGIVCAPRAANLQSILGYVARQLGDTDAAEGAYRRAMELAPNSVDPLLALADLYRTINRAPAALPLLRKALRIEPSSDRVCAELAQLLEQMGEKTEAAHLWAEVTARSPTSKHHHAQLIHLLMQGGKTKEAVQATMQALNSFPSDPEFTGELAAALDRLGKIDEAIVELSNALNVHPLNTRLLTRYADLLMRKGELVKAETAYRQVISLAPNSAHCLGQLGHIFSQQKRHDEAVAARSEACAIEPKNAHRRVQLGHVLLSAGRLAEAEEAIRVAIESEPNFAAFHLDLGHVLDRAARPKEAIDAVLRALDLDSNNARGYAFLGHLFLNSQRLDDAEVAYRRAIKLAPSELQWQIQLVRVLVSQGRMSEAREVADVALLHDPGNTFLRSHSSKETSGRAVAG